MGDVTTGPDLAEGEVPTMRDRMHAAGLSAERIAVHAEANAIALDGELWATSTGPHHPAPAGTSSDVDTTASTRVAFATAQR